jgi:tetratricopeptide (TPR) repeat protein|tara:strand:- start:1105 stop:2340 length:1236 start_codon:yes stop_codon:yes gene_type:complete
MKSFSRIAFVAGMALTLPTLIGCAGGHGKYTQEHISLAKEKMSFMKSATEWDLARQAFLSGDLEKALTKVNGSIEINDTVVKSHVLKSRILIEMGDLGNAIKSLHTAETLSPEDADTQYYLGVVFERLNRPEEALTHFENACEFDDYNPSYAVAASEMLIDLDRSLEARRYLESIPMSVNNAGIQQTLGHIALINHDSKQAELHFRDARLLAPDDTGILEQLIHTQMQNGHFADAERNIAALLQNFEHKDRRDLKLLHAKALMGTQRPVEARSIYQDLLSQTNGKSDLDAWIGLGNTSYSINDDRTARRAAARIVAIQPSSHEGYVLWAMIHRRSGDMDKSLTSINDAIDRNNSDADLFAFRAVVQRDLGMTKSALSSASRALSLEPSNKELSGFVRSLEASVVASVPGED